MSFSEDLNLLIESVCLSSVVTEFHIERSAKENERCPNVFVRSLGIHRIPLSEKNVNFFWVC